MRIRVIIDDVPQDRVNQHPHRFSVAEECIVLDKDLTPFSVEDLEEMVKTSTGNFLRMWGYK